MHILMLQDYIIFIYSSAAFGTTHNLVVTSIDSHENIGKKYSSGISNVRELEEKGCLVLYSVDAKEMKNNHCQIQLNKRLVKGFLSNAKVLLRKEAGEIHVTHKEGDPYNKQ
ncbi:unnamed protein product [Lupinus luteus]|uniref:25S rRNA (uridine-N(3))-methyltransferase BMT5-like domain-containing protein n=1 Tax=Lupinus luteus TaxID=3873 RepID=A0AAV1VS98_LUPLU